MLFWDCLPKNESRFLIKFLINANQIKLKYSLLTSSFIQCCNKDVIIYSGASVSEFIRAIRSFISIDNTFQENYPFNALIQSVVFLQNS